MTAQVEGINFNGIMQGLSVNGLVKMDTENNRLVYVFPVFDNLEKAKGLAIFYLSVKDLFQYLVKESVIELGNSLNIVSNGYIINLDSASLSILSQIERRFEDEGSETFIIPLTIDENNVYIFCSKSEYTGYGGHQG